MIRKAQFKDLPIDYYFIKIDSIDKNIYKKISKGKIRQTQTYEETIERKNYLCWYSKEYMDLVPMIALQEKETTQPHIKVWTFEQAPQIYKDLSNHGGDEDCVILIPKSLQDSSIYIPSFSELLSNDSGGTLSTWGCVERYQLEEGLVIICAHA